MSFYNPFYSPSYYNSKDINGICEDYSGNLHKSEEGLQANLLKIKNNHEAYERGGECSITPKIPLITHHIWLTNPANPKQLQERMLEWAARSSEVLSNEKGWDHYIWVNDKEALAPTVDKLEKLGFEIHEVNELSNLYLEKEIYQSISNNKFGLASDMLRYEILNKIGGVYYDTDYEVITDVTKIHHIVDMYAGIEPFGKVMFGNAIIASKANHPVLDGVLKHIQEWYNPETSPKFLEDCAYFQKTIHITGPFAFSKAFFEYSNQDGNYDITLTPLSVYPSGYEINASMYDFVKELGMEENIRDMNMMCAFHNYGNVVASYFDCEDQYCKLIDLNNNEIRTLGCHYWTGTWGSPEFGSNG